MDAYSIRILSKTGKAIANDFLFTGCHDRYNTTAIRIDKEERRQNLFYVLPDTRPEHERG